MKPSDNRQADGVGDARVPAPIPAGSQDGGNQDSTCRCGHPRESHRHYRPGSDCSLCGPEACKKFRRQGGLLGVLRPRG